MSKMRTLGSVISLLFIVAGIVVLAKIPYFYLHSKNEGAHLIQTAKAKLVSANTDRHPVSNIKKPSSGALIGVVNIPVLSLNAPIIEGTTNHVLNHGSGHLSTSVMPGERGTV